MYGKLEQLMRSIRHRLLHLKYDIQDQWQVFSDWLDKEEPFWSPAVTVAMWVFAAAICAGFWLVMVLTMPVWLVVSLASAVTGFAALRVME